MAYNKNVRYPSYYDSSIDDATLDPELATPDSDGLMSKEDKVKLDSIIYEGGEISQVVKASNVVVDSEHRFVSDIQKAEWDAKADATLVTAEQDGLMDNEDKVKLDSVEPGANYYVHPETHTAETITQDETHRFVTDEQISKWDKGSSASIEYDESQEALILF